MIAPAILSLLSGWGRKVLLYSIRAPREVRLQMLSRSVTRAYCFWHEGGKLKKAYIKKAYIRMTDVKSVRAVCQAKRLRRRQLKREFDSWRNLQRELRGVEQYARS
jgi:hypothetical protein